MHHINHCFFFLLIALSIRIGEVESENAATEFVREYSKDGGTNIIDSNEHVLKVSDDGILHDTKYSLVCKGTYDDIPVAIKITQIVPLFDREIRVYEALNAMNDTNVESHGIPRVYYHGDVFEAEFMAIAMSLFEEAVEQRFTSEPEPFSELSVLGIFKQAVEVLQYLNSKRVVHNDIKPQNLLLRATKVFIADFDLSSLDRAQVKARKGVYASSNNYVSRILFPMDDLESLIFSMWHIAGLESSDLWGSLLMEEKRKNKAKSWIKKTCERFESKIVRKVFTDICIEEILSEREVPQYDTIIEMLSAAINEVTQIADPTELKWLSRKPSKLTRPSKSRKK